jgi:predicted nucleic acid-binding protein
MDLIARHPHRFLATNHVEAEITAFYPQQQSDYQACVSAGEIDTCSVVDTDEVNLFLKLRQSNRLGYGECSAIAVALTRHHAIAMDDNRAVSRALCEAGLVGTTLQVLRTPDVMVDLIRSGVLTIAEADVIKDAWAQHHRFRIKAASFADLL